MISEPDYWIAKAASLVKARVAVTEYIPQRRKVPPGMPAVESAWKGIESILEDILDRFHIPRQNCLEFGVEHGYSTVALASFFERVTGVDTFAGDIHTTDHGDFYEQTSARISAFSNITLVRSDYRDWIATDDRTYDLIHVDIVHTYADTFACGLWAAHHSECVLFHDTESFPAVKQAVLDIARTTGRRFYNYRKCFGLGILV